MKTLRVLFVGLAALGLVSVHAIAADEAAGSKADAVAAPQGDAGAAKPAKGKKKKGKKKAATADKSEGTKLSEPAPAPANPQ